MTWYFQRSCDLSICSPNSEAEHQWQESLSGLRWTLPCQHNVFDLDGWVWLGGSSLEAFGVPVVSRTPCCYFKSVRDKIMDGDLFGNTHSLSSKVWLKWALLKGSTLHMREVTFLWSFAKIRRKNNGLERWLEDPANWRPLKTWKIIKTLKILEYRRDK